MKPLTEDEGDGVHLAKAFRTIASISQAGGEHNIQGINNISIQKNQFKSHFTNRHHRRVGDIMLNYFRFSGNVMKFEEYCSQVEKLMTMNDSEKFKLWFEIFDLDNDGKISVNDILSSMKRLQDTDMMNMNDFEELIKYQNKIAKQAENDSK